MATSLLVLEHTQYAGLLDVATSLLVLEHTPYAGLLDVATSLLVLGHTRITGCGYITPGIRTHPMHMLGYWMWLHHSWY